MKTVFAILTLTFLIMSCKDNGDSIIEENNQVKVQDSSSSVQTEPSNPTTDLIYKTENLRLFGDTSIDNDKISYAHIKFDLYVEFEDFKVNEVDHSKDATLDLKSHEQANKYRTRLREGYKSDTANFAGHYTFVYFGCGSPCQNSFIIDRKTGNVYDSPGASVGYDFRVDSRMLIVNPPDTSGFYFDCSYCKPIIYVLNEQTKEFREPQ